MFLVHPTKVFAFDKTVWDPASIVDAGGLGIRNFWTFVGAEPLGDQKDMVLNSSDEMNAINPLYISGATDSWVTELIWDRLMRIGAGRPAAALGRRELQVARPDHDRRSRSGRT